MIFFDDFGKWKAAPRKEYLDLGHMSSVSAADIGLCRYFLPHHCVIKEVSSTTKLRVVFDGLAASSSGYSLNDVLIAGLLFSLSCSRFFFGFVQRFRLGLRSFVVIFMWMI